MALFPISSLQTGQVDFLVVCLYRSTQRPQKKCPLWHCTMMSFSTSGTNKQMLHSKLGEEQVEEAISVISRNFSQFFSFIVIVFVY